MAGSWLRCAKNDVHHKEHIRLIKIKIFMRKIHSKKKLELVEQFVLFCVFIIVIVVDVVVFVILVIVIRKRPQ